MAFTLPATAHTDGTMAVRLDTVELGPLDVTWALTRNGETVDAVDWIDGSFEAGSFCFRGEGVYGLTAFVTDATGRVFFKYRKAEQTSAARGIWSPWWYEYWVWIPVWVQCWHSSWVSDEEGGYWED